MLYPNELRALKIQTVSYNIQTYKSGRGGEIRTPDPLLPKQLRYQAALHPVRPFDKARNLTPKPTGRQSDARPALAAAPARTLRPVLDLDSGLRQLIAQSIRLGPVLFGSRLPA